MDSSWAIFRAVIFGYSKVSEATTTEGFRGLDKWFQTSYSEDRGVIVEHAVYRVSEVGFLIQKLGGRYAETIWTSRIVFKDAKPSYLVCRYHEDTDYGERVEYCSKLTRSSRGYCSLHANTPKVLYEMCAQGVDDACRKASRYFDKESFTVYLLDYGGSRVKVGLTRSSRFLWRISEQPHIATAQVFVGDLISSRIREKELGRHRFATEGPGARLEKRVELAMKIVEERGSDASFLGRRVASFISILGLSGTFRSYTILPNNVSLLKKAMRIDIEKLLGRKLIVKDYWGGFVVFSDEDTGEYFLVSKKSLLHYPIRVILSD